MVQQGVERWQLINRLLHWNRDRAGFLILEFSRLEISDSLDLGSSIGMRHRNHLDVGSLRLGGRAAVAHDANVAALILILSRNIYVTNGSLEHDERVSTVVVVCRQCFARGTEVYVVADGAFVAHALDVGLVGILAAEWSIAVDAEMSDCRRALVSDWLVESGEAVTWVGLASILDTVIAVIPVWAIQALVTHAVDLLVTAIANRVVADIAASSKLCLCRKWENSVLRGWLECMSWMVAMLVSCVTLDAQVEVVTSGTSDELALGEDDYAAVARAGRNVRFFGQSLGLVSEGTRHLRHHSWRWLDKIRDRHDLAWGDTLSGAVDDLAVLDRTLDEPVTLSRAQLAIVDTLLAQVVVTIIADAAVVVLVLHGFVALIAVDSPGMCVNGSWTGWFSWTEDERHRLGGWNGHAVEEARAGGIEGARDRCLIIDKGLLGGTGLPELEDTTPDRAAIECGRVAR